MAGQRIRSEDGVANAIAIIHRNIAFREEQQLLLQQQQMTPPFVEPGMMDSEVPLSPDLTTQSEAGSGSPTISGKRFSYIRNAFRRATRTSSNKVTDEDHGYASDSSISYASPQLGRKVASPTVKPSKIRRRRFLRATSVTTKHPDGSLSDGEASENARRLCRSASASPAKMNETTLASYVAKHLQVDCEAPTLLGKPRRPDHLKHRQHHSADPSSMQRLRLRSSSNSESEEPRRPTSRGVLSRVSGFFKD
jgi:hypothetical protein